MKNSAKTKIMAAALEIFSRHGYENSTIKMICEQAEVNIAAVNYHFGCKKDLYITVVNELADQLLPRMRTDLESSLFKTIEQPERFIEELIKLAISCEDTDIHSFWHEIMHREISSPSEAFELIYDRNFKPFIESIRQSLQAMLPDCDQSQVKYLLFMVLAQIHMIKGAPGMLTGYFGKDVYSKEKIQELAKNIAAVTCYGIRGI
ncbi:CerR family C-terminal domain-containing protein [Lentisphaerota bacterium ZTH]|nr:CerR family C-terminal domain-containing protein [Lentisphaerota bacterium]WET06881.1 CerR family C-terminal domain-containing protein [Lentisphaerota bacterium ZTH]